MCYGPGWIPAPDFNSLQYQVDGQNAANKLCWKSKFKDSESSADVPMDLLKKKVTAPCLTVEDPVITQIKSTLVNFVDNIKDKPLKSNMNRFEKEGLEWLKSAVNEGKIAVTSADKGGAIIVVTPEIIKDITKKKLEDTSCYTDIGQTNPLPALKSKMEKQWVQGYTESYVTRDQIKKTVGVIMKDDSSHTLSTSDQVKAGISFGYPSLKAHKVTPEDLKNKVIPPSRFVSDLSNGVTSRSDKFIVWCWLAPLARDYAVDLVKDSTGALILLDDLEKSGKISSNSLHSFGIDVVSLYDSLQHSLVLNALDDAMSVCRPEWDNNFRTWLKDLVLLSFESAVIKFEDTWFKSENGVPTGGIPSVDIGNISVYYVLKNLVYSESVHPRELISLTRFVDDGSGIWDGDEQSLREWFQLFRTSSVALYSLDFTLEVTKITEYSQFLDICFKFVDGSLTTDIFRKPTDANRYLNFSSYHPNHTFYSIIYSQGIRYRRIINNDALLSVRLDELQEFFVRSAYPPKLVKDVMSKIKQMPRDLGYKANNQKNTCMTPWTVTYAHGFNEAKNMSATVNESLVLSDTWKNSDEADVPKVKVVYKRGKNLKDILFRRKSIALNTPNTSTVPCMDPGIRKRGAKCQCCLLVSKNSCVLNNNRTVQTVGGNCKTINIIYCATCTLCQSNNVYVGKSVSALHERVNQHRFAFYEILRKSKRKDDYIENMVVDDKNVLGAHIVKFHRKLEQADFNKSFKFDIAAICSPDNLRFMEQTYINRLHTLVPFGLNNINSIGS